MLSLFWLTRWGRSEVDCRATNDAAMSHAMLKLYQRLAEQLRADVERLLALGSAHYGAANSPLLDLDHVRRRRV